MHLCLIWNKSTLQKIVVMLFKHLKVVDLDLEIQFFRLNVILSINWMEDMVIGIAIVIVTIRTLEKI